MCNLAATGKCWENSHCRQPWLQLECSAAGPHGTCAVFGIPNKIPVCPVVHVGCGRRLGVRFQLSQHGVHFPWHWKHTRHEKKVIGNGCLELDSVWLPRSWVGVPFKCAGGRTKSSPLPMNVLYQVLEDPLPSPWEPFTKSLRTLYQVPSHKSSPLNYLPLIWRPFIKLTLFPPLNAPFSPFSPAHV